MSAWEAILQCPNCGGDVGAAADTVRCSACGLTWPDRRDFCDIGGRIAVGCDADAVRHAADGWRAALWLGSSGGRNGSSPGGFAERYGLELSWRQLPDDRWSWKVISSALQSVDGVVVRVRDDVGMAARERMALVAAALARKPVVLDRSGGPVECWSADVLWEQMGKRLVQWYRLPPLDRLIARARARQWRRYSADRRWAGRWLKRYLGVEPSAVTGWQFFDLGCGEGRHLALAGQFGARGVGLDLSSSAKWREIPSTIFLRGGAGDLAAVRGERFDCCLAIQVLMYLQDDVGTLRQLRRLLKPDGRLLVQVTNAGNLRARWAGKRLSDEPVRRYYRRDQIERLIQEAGFQVERVWMEHVYAPWFTGFWGWVLEVLLPPIAMRWAERLTPPSCRGLITILGRAV